MRPIAIIQHVEDDGPAYFADWLDQAGMPFRLFRMHAGEVPPSDLTAHAGLCLLGGPMSANDDLPYYPALYALIRDAIARSVPVIGHCLGGQMLARALGATVQASPHVEIGWSDLRLLDGADAGWFGGQARFRLFQWHGESFALPDGATALVTGDYCPNQAFLYGGLHLGMQFHCEVDEAKVRTWLVNGHDELISSRSPAVQQADRLLPTLAQDVQASQQVAAAIYRRWAQGLAR